jgi:hypothetical protein
LQPGRSAAKCCVIAMEGDLLQRSGRSPRTFAVAAGDRRSQRLDCRFARRSKPLDGSFTRCEILGVELADPALELIARRRSADRGRQHKPTHSSRHPADPDAHRRLASARQAPKRTRSEHTTSSDCPLSIANHAPALGPAGSAGTPGLLIDGTSAGRWLPAICTRKNASAWANCLSGSHCRGPKQAGDQLTDFGRGNKLLWRWQLRCGVASELAIENARWNRRCNKTRVFLRTVRVAGGPTVRSSRLIPRLKTRDWSIPLEVDRESRAKAAHPLN